MAETAQENYSLPLLNLLDANGSAFLEALLFKIDSQDNPIRINDIVEIPLQIAINTLLFWGQKRYPNFEPAKGLNQLLALVQVEEKLTAEPASRPTVAMLKQWQEELAEKEAGQVIVPVLQRLELEQQLNLLQAYRQNLSGLDPSAVSDAEKKEALRLAIQQTSEKQTNQEFELQVIEPIKRAFVRQVEEQKIADEKIKARIGQQTAKAGSSCGQNAAEIYQQYLKHGWPPTGAAKAAAKEALKSSLESTVTTAVIDLPEAEKQLVQVLEQNTGLIQSTVGNLKQTIDPLQIAVSADYQETAALCEKALINSLQTLGLSSEQISRLRPELQKTSQQTINRLSLSFTEKNKTSPDTAVFQQQLEKELKKTLFRLAPAKIRRKNKALIEGLSRQAGKQIGTTAFNYLRFQPSIKSGFAETGGFGALEAVLTHPSLIPKIIASLIIPDRKIQGARLERLAEKTNLDFFTLKTGLAGYTPTAVQNLIAGLESGQSVFNIWGFTSDNLSLAGKILILKRLRENLAQIEPLINQPRGLNQRLFSLQAKLNQAKYDLFEQAGKVNLFRPMFFARELLNSDTLARAGQIIKPISGYQEQTAGAGFGWLISSFYNLKVNWHNFKQKRPQLNKTLNSLNKLKPNYWLKTGLKNTGRKLAGKTGSWLIRHAGGGILKAAGAKLLGLGVETAVTAAAGVATGGTAAVVIGAAKILKKIVFSEQGKQLIKKAGEIAAAGIGAVIGLAAKIFSAYKFTLLGALAGSFFGPAGTVLGMGAGYAIDKGIIPFFRNLGAGLGAATGSGGFGLSAGAGGGGIAVAGGASTTAAIGGGILSPALAVPFSLGTIGFLSFMNQAVIRSAFVKPSELGSNGPGIEEYSQNTTLKVTKTASPAKISANKEIIYHLEVTSQDGGLKNVVIDDNPDLEKIEIISVSPQPTDTQNMIWNIDQMLKQGQISQDFSAAGATLTIDYTARAKPGISENDKIYNQIIITATDSEEKQITRKAYAIINNDCSDIVAKAAEIMNDLIMASENKCKQINPGCVDWILTNRWEGYLHGYNCPVSSDIRQQTNPLSTTNGCVVCNDLVTIAYRLTGYPDPRSTDWENTAKNWKQQGILVIENGKGNINHISAGDIVYFDVQRTRDNNSTYLDKFSHVGIVAGVTSTGIYTWESNTPSKGQRYYAYFNNQFSPLGGVVFINAIGNTCQE